MDRPPALSPVARTAFGVTALLAWLGVTLNLVLVVFAVYPSTTVNPHLLGFNQGGIDGLFGRVVDYLSYFTILSNIVVAGVCTALWRGRARPTTVMRALRMDALVMITVTGLVYSAVLAADAKLQGLQYVTNTLEHYVTPILAIVTWALWGPRRWLRLSSVATAMVLPVAWLAYTLVRGAFVDAYPYPFLNVADLGLSRVVVNIVGILCIGLVLGLVFWAVDRLLGARSPAPFVVPVTEDAGPGL